MALFEAADTCDPWSIPWLPIELCAALRVVHGAVGAADLRTH